MIPNQPTNGLCVRRSYGLRIQIGHVTIDTIGQVGCHLPVMWTIRSSSRDSIRLGLMQASSFMSVHFLFIFPKVLIYCS